MKATIGMVLKNIKADCVEWNTQCSVYRPEEIKLRRQMALKAKDLFRSLVSIFVCPKISGTGTVYLFEGLRNKGYIGAFDRGSVFVIGSHTERAFAKSKGYGFIWAFPIEASVRSEVFRGWGFFALLQLLYWRNVLRGKERVVFFLYEDTQPLGSFIVHLARNLLINTRTVCIQHGYFSALQHPLRYEGVRSEINFVWDDKQAQLMGLDPERTFQIGLPYTAKARPAETLSVVLVGVGAPYGDLVSYAVALDAFQAIAQLAETDLGLDVVYRPHPTESAHPEVIDMLQQRFKSVDVLGKLERLNAARSIYVGSVSSLMFEAKQAGHLVVCVEIQDREKPVFDCDLLLAPKAMDEFVRWARKEMTATPSNAQGEATEKTSGETHLVRFRKAVAQAKLL